MRILMRILKGDGLFFKIVIMEVFIVVVFFVCIDLV